MNNIPFSVFLRMIRFVLRGEKMKARYLVDESGEILEEYSPSDRIIRSGSIEFLRGTEVIRFNFGKLNVDCVKYIDSKVLRYAIDLMEYIEIGSGILRFKNGRTIKSASKMGKIIFNVHTRTAQGIVRNLIKEDIIHKCKDSNGMYFMYNPFIIHVGRRLSKDLVNEFKNSKWRKYTSDKR